MKPDLHLGRYLHHALRQCAPSSAVARRLLAATAVLAVTWLPSAAARAATNVLANPGFETGTFAGWTGYGNHAVESTNNTYYNGGLAGGSNVLTHSGIYVGKTWGQFTGLANYNGFYQDAVAASGSVWSAAGWALTHHQDLISGGNTCWIEVTFRDATDTVLALYRSANIDASSTPDTWIYLPVTNQLDPSAFVITNTVTSFTAPAATAKARYQIVFAQPAGYDGGSVYFDDLDLEKIAASDPDISAGPTNLTRVVGQTATFTVVATGGTTLSYQWQKNGTNLVNGGNVSGATSAALTVSNLALADTGGYSVEVSDAAGSLTSTPATLTVVTVAEASNVLGNPGFETGVDYPWVRFNGGGLHTTNDFYFGSGTPVSVHGGLWVSQTYGSAEWNGLYQDVAAGPGAIFTADAWFLTAAEDPISGTNTAWLEVQFQDAGGNMLALYKSAVIDTNTPTSVWMNLAATNLIAIWSDYSVAGNAKYLVAPAGTAKVRYQVTFHALGGGGSVWYDDMHLMRKIPVALTAALSGGQAQLSFATQIGVNYQVVYKTNLTDTAWLPLTAVTGDGTVKTVADPTAGTQRFYRVLTL